MQEKYYDDNDVSILNRIFQPNAPTASSETAQDILALDFDQADKDRMRELSAKARVGTLSAEEVAEASRYEVVGHLLNVMQSRARRSLKCSRGNEGASKR